MPIKRTQRNIKNLTLEFKLDEIDKQMLAHKIQSPWITDDDLADLLNMERRAINERRSRKIWQDAYAEAVMPHKDYLAGKMEKAVRMYWKLASSKNETIAERVLSKLLVHWKVLRLEANQEAIQFDPIVVHMPLYQKTVMITEKKEEKIVEPNQDRT